jgi:hypothetical protein
VRKTRSAAGEGLRWYRVARRGQAFCSECRLNANSFNFWRRRALRHRGVVEATAGVGASEFILVRLQRQFRARLKSVCVAVARFASMRVFPDQNLHPGISWVGPAKTMSLESRPFR